MIRSTSVALGSCLDKCNYESKNGESRELHFERGLVIKS